MWIDWTRLGGVRAVVLAAVLAGCGGASHNADPAPVSAVAPQHVESAGCGGPPAWKAPSPQETGVYRAGPVTLVVGEDLAQQPNGALAGGSGTDAIVVLTGDRRAMLRVDPGSAGRFSLQFVTPTSPSQAVNGEAAVRFPACGQRVHRFIGGISFRGRGCVMLWVRVDGQRPIPMPIPIGDTLRGCPTEPSRRMLGAGAEPFLGVACHPANSVGCGRVGVGVALKPSAALVMVEIAGRLVTLTPPDPPSDLWLGYLYGAGLRRGPLDVHIPTGRKLWFGEPPVYPRVRLTVFFADARVVSAEFADFLHAGFG
jgi:hypothetical protein